MEAKSVRREQKLELKKLERKVIRYLMVLEVVSYYANLLLYH
jgi:hypothetical protein